MVNHIVLEISELWWYSNWGVLSLWKCQGIEGKGCAFQYDLEELLTHSPLAAEGIGRPTGQGTGNGL